MLSALWHFKRHQHLRPLRRVAAAYGALSGRKAVALRVGVDMRRPPDESDAPFIALFPDAVSERGLKHLGTLKGIVAAGERAAMFYCIQRPDAWCFGPADMIDPAYAVGLRDAVAHGVEVYPHLAVLTVEGIGLEAECLSMV